MIGVLGRCCFEVLFGVLFEVLVTVRAHFVKFDSNVLEAVWGAAAAFGVRLGRRLGCCWRCW